MYEIAMAELEVLQYKQDEVMTYEANVFDTLKESSFQACRKLESQEVWVNNQGQKKSLRRKFFKLRNFLRLLLSRYAILYIHKLRMFCVVHLT
jgi:hypothetical protein